MKHLFFKKGDGQSKRKGGGFLTAFIHVHLFEVLAHVIMYWSAAEFRSTNIVCSASTVFDQDGMTLRGLGLAVPYKADSRKGVPGVRPPPPQNFPRRLVHN